MTEETEIQRNGAEDVVWNLSDLYVGVDDPAIERDMQATDIRAQQLEADYRGRLTSLDAEELYEAIEVYEEIVESAVKIESFAHLIWSTDTANPAYGKLMQKATEWTSRLQQQLVFFDLEWVNAPEDFAARMIANPTLEHYAHWLEASRRYQPHRLSEPEEKILAEKAVTGREAWVRYFTELMGGLRFPFDGEQLTQSAVLSKLYDPDRSVRAKAAKSVTEVLRAQLPGLTYIFNTLLADKASDDRLRDYPTWISSRNLSNEVSDEVVDALIEAVTTRSDIVARYYKLKRQLLDVDELFDYDRYAPLPAAEGQYAWGTARERVLAAYKRFHPRVAEIAQMFFTESWIDAAPAPNKRGGAYSAGTVPSVHPYVFMNYTGSARDVMTLAHELGHGIHQYLSREQGMLQASTPLTTAEMASTFGEMLVFTDMMAKEDDPKARLAMLAHKIEDTFATVFRQISMNRFENGIHEARREEGELTSDRLSEIWMETQQAMFLDSVTLTDNYSIWWSYIPHFLHTPGYVYAYAFGELLVMALFARYRQEAGTGFEERYMDVLRAGGSDWPEKVLAPMGVDLTDPAFWQEGLIEIEAMITQAEQLASQL